MTRNQTIDLTFERFISRYENGAKGDVKGVNREIKKLVLLSKHATQVPTPGESWNCRVVHDTKPEDPSRGILFVLPLNQKTHREHWYYECKHRLDLGEPLIVVTYRKNFGVTNQLWDGVLEEKQFEVRCEADIHQEWPDARKASLQEELKSYAIKRADWLEASTRVTECFHVQSECNYALGQPLIAVRCRRTVGFETPSEKRFEVKSEADIAPEWPDDMKLKIVSALQRYELKRAEWLEFNTKERIEWSVAWDGTVPNRFPKVIRTAMLGHATVATDSVVVTSEEQFTPEWTDWVVRNVRARLVDAAAANLKKAKELERKALIASLKREPDGKIRFQWAGEFLTDGEVFFPKVRPKGQEWRKMPIEAVPEGYWETFLSGLAGKLRADLLHYRSGESWRNPVKPRISLTDRQKQIEATIKEELEKTIKEKAMWQGDGVDAVAVGKCVVFFVLRRGHPDLYVVDNPGPGAIYCFADKLAAYKLAQNGVTRRDLIKQGAKRILHTPGWRKKLSEVIAAA